MTPYYSTKASEATLHRRQNHKSNDDSNTQQLRTPKETHTLTKRKNEGKKEGGKKERKKKTTQESKKERAIKTIDKPMSEN